MFSPSSPAVTTSNFEGTTAAGAATTAGPAAADSKSFVETLAAAAGGDEPTEETVETAKLVPPALAHVRGAEGRGVVHTKDGERGASGRTREPHVAAPDDKSSVTIPIDPSAIPPQNTPPVNIPAVPLTAHGALAVEPVPADLEAGSSTDAESVETDAERRGGVDSAWHTASAHKHGAVHLARHGAADALGHGAADAQGHGAAGLRGYGAADLQGNGAADLQVGRINTEPLRTPNGPAVAATGSARGLTELAPAANEPAEAVAAQPSEDPARVSNGAAPAVPAALLRAASLTLQHRAAQALGLGTQSEPSSPSVRTVSARPGSTVAQSRMNARENAVPVEGNTTGPEPATSHEMPSASSGSSSNQKDGRAESQPGSRLGGAAAASVSMPTPAPAFQPTSTTTTTTPSLSPSRRTVASPSASVATAALPAASPTSRDAGAAFAPPPSLTAARLMMMTGGISHNASPLTASSIAAEAAGALPVGVTQQIVEAIRLQWSGGRGAAQIQLEPTQFGDLSVSLRVDQGQVTARLEASSPIVREWLQNNQTTLRDALAEQNLTLDRLEVAEPAESRDAERRDSQQPPPRDSRQARRPHRPETGELFEIVA